MSLTRHGWALIVVVGVVLWSNTLDHPFHYDDAHSIVDNVHLRQVDLGAFFGDPATFSVDADKGMYRPLLVTTFALNHAVGGLDVTGYHVVNVAVHLAVALVVWWLAGALGGGPAARLLAGLLFVVHPVGSEPVNYISSRSESLAALFYLSGLALFLRADAHARAHAGTGQGGHAGSGRGELAWLAGAWACLAAGLSTKSTTATLPAALLLLDAAVLQRGDLAALRRRWLRWHAPGWAILAGYVVVVTQNTWLTRSLAQQVREPLAQALTQLTGFVWYLRLLVWPVDLNVEPQFAEQSSWAPVVGAAGLVVVSWGFAVIRAWQRRRGRRLFLLALPVLHLLPTLVVPLNVLVNERRAYLPVAVACLGLALWLPRRPLPGRRRLALAGLAALAVLSWQRSEVWADAVSLWSDAVETGPRMPRSHLYLGNTFKDAALRTADPAAALARWRSASAAYERAFREAEGRDPELARRALNNRGGVHWKLSTLTAGAASRAEFERAEALFREAVARDPRFVDGLVNLGSCLLQEARSTTDGATRRRLLGESLQYYGRALALRPNHHQAHGNVGVALEDLGRWDEAERAYRQALYLAPADFTNLKNLAQLLSRRAAQDLAAGRREPAAGRLREAVELAARALQINPATPGARQVLQGASARLRSLEGR